MTTKRHNWNWDEFCDLWRAVAIGCLLKHNLLVLARGEGENQETAAHEVMVAIMALSANPTALAIGSIAQLVAAIR